MKLCGKKWRLRRKLKASPIKSFLSTTFLAMLAVSFTVFLNYMGVFTHAYEKDYYTEFSYPLDVDLQPLVKQHIDGKVPTTEPINLFNYSYLKSCENKCSKNSNPVIVFVVKSALPHFNRRQAIRQTWGNQNRFSDVPMRRVFLLGTGFDPDIQRLIDQESALHGDIVQADFHDDYRNNTLKTMSGFKWAVEKCSSGRFFVFADDDMYISTKNLLRFIRNPLNYPESQPTPTVKGNEHRERSLKQENPTAIEDHQIRGLNESTSSSLSEELENEDYKLYAGKFVENFFSLKGVLTVLFSSLFRLRLSHTATAAQAQQVVRPSE